MSLETEKEGRRGFGQILGVAATSVLVSFVILQQIFAIFITLYLDPFEWVDFLQDDAYYYLGIARNLAEFGNSMFAAPMHTNGFQPLWLWILTVAAKAVGGDRVLLVSMLHAIALVAIIGFLVLSRRYHGAMWPAALAVLLFPNVMTAGMETVLIPVLALLYFRSETWRSKGVFASLLFLARLDTLALVAGRVVYDLVARRRLGIREHLPLIATIVAYMGVNFALFGTPVPVSGLAKAVGNLPGENLPSSLRLLRRVLPTAIALLPLVVWRWGGAYKFRNPAAVTASLCAVGISALYYGVMSGWPLWSWYLWPVMLAAYFALVELAHIDTGLPAHHKLAGHGWRLIAVALLMTHMSAAFWVYHGRYRPVREHLDGTREPFVFFDRDNVLVSKKLNEAMAPNTTFAMGDRAGSLGYFLNDHFRFIQLEGLVGSYEQIQQMRADKSVEFIKALKPDWLIVDRDEPLNVIDGQFVIEEPYQGLSVHTGSYVLCFPLTARASNKLFGSQRDTRYFFRFDARAECTAAAVAWFDQWRARYHGPIRGNLGRLPLFMQYPGDL